MEYFGILVGDHWRTAAMKPEENLESKLQQQQRLSSDPLRRQVAGTSTAVGFGRLPPP